jgi:hypothetical protein
VCSVRNGNGNRTLCKKPAHTGQTLADQTPDYTGTQYPLAVGGIVVTTCFFLPMELITISKYPLADNLVPDLAILYLERRYWCTTTFPTLRLFLPIPRQRGKRGKVGRYCRVRSLLVLLNSRPAYYPLNSLTNKPPKFKIENASLFLVVLPDCKFCFPGEKILPINGGVKCYRLWGG